MQINCEVVLWTSSTAIIVYNNCQNSFCWISILLVLSFVNVQQHHKCDLCLSILFILSFILQFSLRLVSENLFLYLDVLRHLSNSSLTQDPPTHNISLKSLSGLLLSEILGQKNKQRNQVKTSWEEVKRQTSQNRMQLTTARFIGFTNELKATIRVAISRSLLSCYFFQRQDLLLLAHKVKYKVSVQMEP